MLSAVHWPCNQQPGQCWQHCSSGLLGSLAHLTLNEGSSKQGKALRAAMDSNCVDAMTRVLLAASAAARDNTRQQQLTHTAGSRWQLFHRHTTVVVLDRTCAVLRKQYKPSQHPVSLSLPSPDNTRALCHMGPNGANSDRPRPHTHTYVAAPVEAIQTLLQRVTEPEPQHRHQRRARQRMRELQDDLLRGLVTAAHTPCASTAAGRSQEAETPMSPGPSDAHRQQFVNTRAAATLLLSLQKASTVCCDPVCTTTSPCWQLLLHPRTSPLMPAGCCLCMLLSPSYTSSSTDWICRLFACSTTQGVASAACSWMSTSPVTVYGGCSVLFTCRLYFTGRMPLGRYRSDQEQYGLSCADMYCRRTAGQHMAHMHTQHSSVRHGCACARGRASCCCRAPVN